ncbi:potassium channel family protein [Yinghuangia sp. ASG 101]|uniref:potassium channel family protein n=1 Tax=Yinghuangia sp. ASG 101 TaxID=2896848 RepID=UPI001E41A898|nr:potassium channel family protein [Yinghuangia sp. ASG 101]UGQ13646.1 potassium channel family protein [Yinghuangia sp. ASG 101]
MSTRSQPDGKAAPERTESPWWVAVRAIGALVVLLVAFYTLPDQVHSTSEAVRTVVFALCVGAFAALIVLLIARGQRGGFPARAEGLLLTVVASIVFFATVYDRLAQQSDQFAGLVTRTDALYFTLVTTATVGYGDITATGQASRIAVMVQIVFNLVFLGAGVSVALDRIKQHRRAAAKPED